MKYFQDSAHKVNNLLRFVTSSPSWIVISNFSKFFSGWQSGTGKPFKPEKKQGKKAEELLNEELQKAILLADSRGLLIDELIISKRKLNEELQKAIALAESRKQIIEELKHFNNEIEQFAYIASHDLQEPLRGISNYVGLFQKKYQNKLDEKADYYLHFISEATIRMQTLINSLLEYSRIGRWDSEMTEIDCNKLLQSVLKDISHIIKESNTEINAEVLPVIKGYLNELTSLFKHLICNAIKFKKREEHPIITITGKEKGDQWLFAIKDNGIGIDKRYHNRIFIIFQRLHTQKEFPGIGIGLAYCKKIVELHKGKIWVESEPAQVQPDGSSRSGSTFYFTIPKSLNDLHFN
jgi:light-regulated signal transduction histidine kinase (bacteriophytochrome)